MRFGYTILYVEDVARAIDFYERAFELTRRFVADDATYGEMETGDTTLSFASHALVGEFIPGGYRRNDPAQPPAGVEIGFVTDDVPAAWDTALAAGAVAVSPPTTKPWGQTVAYVRDPEGMLVEICTPVTSQLDRQAVTRVPFGQCEATRFQPRHLGLTRSHLWCPESRDRCSSQRPTAPELERTLRCPGSSRVRARFGHG